MEEASLVAQNQPDIAEEKFLWRCRFYGHQVARP
jgi:hypothetical protein